MRNKLLRPLIVLLLAVFVNACTASPNTVLDMRLAVEAPRFGDTDPVSWTGKTPNHYQVHGIDVSKYQGQIDWGKTRRGGIAFAFIKATEGGDHMDERFRQNWHAAGQAGIPRGAYHFYYFCRTAREQARWFIRNVPRDPNSLPPVLDMEWNHGSKTCKHRPSPVKVRSEMRTFLRMVQQYYGKKPLIYTTVDFYSDNHLSLIRDHEFWLRSVADHPSKVYPGQNWSFWQYTGTGQIPGIKGETDINVFAGSPSTWRQWVVARTGQ
ncbi:MAG: glycoside hydrolase family 25 protein [Rhizobiaceae bacterium]